jgi:hypothetical protein
VAEASGPDFDSTLERRGCGAGQRSGGAMIEVEQSAQSLDFVNDPGLVTGARVGEGDDIGDPLMIAFALMVGQKLLERVAQGTFAKRIN